MSETKRTIEVDTEFLESLYGLVDKIPPGEKNINLDLLKDLILKELKQKLQKQLLILRMARFRQNQMFKMKSMSNTMEKISLLLTI